MDKKEQFLSLLDDKEFSSRYSALSEPEQKQFIAGFIGEPIEQKKEGFGQSVLRQSVVEPAKEVLKGVYKGSERFYGLLDGVNDMLGAAGLPSTSFFEEAKGQMKYAAESIDTDMTPVGKIVYQMIGQAPEIAFEMSTLKALPGAQMIKNMPGGQQLSDASAIAVGNAIDEFGDSNEIVKALQSGAGGATVSMSFPVVGKMFSKGMELMSKGFKNGARSYIEFLTKDRGLADDFVKNPNKYTINPRAIVEDVTDVAEKNKFVIDSIKSKQKQDMFNLREQISKKSNEIKSSGSEALANLKAIQKDASMAVANKNDVAMKFAVENATKSIRKNKEVVATELNNVFDDFMLGYKKVKADRGEAVGETINNMIKRDPLVGVDFTPIDRKFNNVVYNFSGSPFTIKFGKIEPRTAATPKEQVNTFRNIYDEFKSKKSDGKLTLRYLQDLKKDLQGLSESYRNSNPQMAGFYGRLSSEINPVNLADDIPGTKGILGELSKANADYSRTIKGFNEASKLYFKTDANGNLIPDIGKAVRAIENNDVGTLKRMLSAEKEIPKEFRVLDKLRGSVKSAREFERQQESTLVAIKKMAKRELLQIKKNQASELAKLQKDVAAGKVKDAQSARTKIFQESKKNADELAETTKKLNDHITFLRDQNKLRSYRPDTSGLARIIQNLSAGAGLSVATITGNPALALQSIAASTALSPVAASGAYKIGSKSIKYLDELSKKAGGSEIANKLATAISAASTRD